MQGRSTARHETVDDPVAGGFEELYVAILADRSHPFGEALAILFVGCSQPEVTSESGLDFAAGPMGKSDVMHADDSPSRAWLDHCCSVAASSFSGEVKSSAFFSSICSISSSRTLAM